MQTNIKRRSLLIGLSLFVLGMLAGIGELLVKLFPSDAAYGMGPYSLGLYGS